MTSNGSDSRDPAAAMRLAERYRVVRMATEELVEPLTDEDCQVQSMPDASPAKWHLAHTTWFFEQFVLTPFAPWYEPFHTSFSYLFNSYYEGVGPRHDRPRRGMLSRPRMEEIRDYRAYIDVAMRRILAESPASAEFRAIVELGTHHEEQHQELLLTDIKHLFSQNPLEPAYRDLPVRAPGRAEDLAFIPREGGLFWVGHGGAGFAFDHESPRHQVFVEPYSLANRLVTNGEYLEFIEAGGYEDPRLWLADGWATVQARGWRAPLYWRREDERWTELTLNGRRGLFLARPVCHVSYYEADAFARWSRARLSTEVEWELCASDLPVEGNLADKQAFHPRPSGDGPGLLQLYGDVWEWTQSPYVFYPGYRPNEGVLGEYNGKFACNQFVLRGGSCVTPRSHIRATYRNFFPPDARWQFSGIRLARDGA